MSWVLFLPYLQASELPTVTQVINGRAKFDSRLYNSKTQTLCHYSVLLPKS